MIEVFVDSLKNYNLMSISQIEIFDHLRKKNINQYLGLGWKLLNINNVIEEQPSFDGDEKISLTIYTLGWPSDLGEVCLPEVDDDFVKTMLDKFS